MQPTTPQSPEQRRWRCCATMSLPLRINLISLVFAALVASVLTGLGGLFLHHQQTENAVNRARLAADDLAGRAGHLLRLGLAPRDIIGFDRQCAAVLGGDPLLRDAALFDARHEPLARNPGGMLAWPAGAPALEVDQSQRLPSAEGALVLRAVGAAPGAAAQAYVLVAVDGGAVLRSTLERVAWLVASAMGLFVIGLVFQQAVFWHTVGRPLAGLVRTADNIRPDDAESLAALRQPDLASEDDIGRLYAAFSRLMQRLLDARAALLQHNEELEATVRERTAELERVNAALASDIARRQALEESLRQLAATDALTGLANRGHVMPHLRRRLLQLQRSGGTLGVMLLDFDGFKAINDTHGHAVGDAVLRTMAARIRDACRASDLPARLGGDEFLVVFEDATDDAAALVLARRIAGLFERPLACDGLSLRVGVSLGLAVYPRHARDVPGLLAAADAAMYAAKQAGGGIRLAPALPSLPPPALADQRAGATSANATA